MSKIRKITAACIFASGLALLLLGSVFAASLVIDNFEPNGPEVAILFPNPPTPQNAFGFAPGGLGGERDILLSGTASTGGDLLRARVVDSKLVFAADASVRGNAQVQWDGEDGSADLDTTGLGVEDLVDGTNDGFHIEVIFNDQPASLILHVWENGTESTASLALPGGIQSDNHVDFFLPFTAFSPEISFTEVGAIVLEIDATVSPGTDLEIRFLDVNNFRDYGDAPATYDGADPARHIPDGLRLGSNLDIEAAPANSPSADGDDLDQSPPNDEDGVTRTPGVNWTPGGTGSLQVVVNGCPGTCYLTGFFDWDDNGSFQTVERMISDRALTNGTHTVNFNMPETVPAFPGDLFARLRLCNASGICSSPRGQVTGGEVEDYLWGFGPTAVTVSSLEARPAVSTGAVAALAAGGLLVLGLALAVSRARRPG